MSVTVISWLILFSPILLGIMGNTLFSTKRRDWYINIFLKIKLNNVQLYSHDYASSHN